MPATPTGKAFLRNPEFRDPQRLAVCLHWSWILRGALGGNDFALTIFPSVHYPSAAFLRYNTFCFRVNNDMPGQEWPEPGIGRTLRAGALVPHLADRTRRIYFRPPRPHHNRSNCSQQRTYSIERNRLCVRRRHA